MDVKAMIQNFMCLVLPIGLLVGCGSSEDDRAQSELVEPIDETLVEKKRVYLNQASEADFEPFIIDAEGQEQLVICHIPPGNPRNFKSKLVPLTAVEAHLNHGHEASLKSENGKKHKHSDNQVYRLEDYLGACGELEVNEDYIVIDDPVFEGDGPVCQGLVGDLLYSCLQEHNQHITVEL